MYRQTGVIFLVLVISLNVMTNKCVPRYYGSSSFVCVCNETYCDTISPTESARTPKGHYLHFVSSKDVKRFDTCSGKFTRDIDETYELIFEINAAKTYQEIHGFGGAFTDATGINIKELPQHSQENLLEAYFSNTGIQYSLCRVPMGATDFSMEPYTYNDIPDSLEHFRIRNEDILYKIPLIKAALEYSKHRLKLIASPWTAPPWMKTNNFYSGIGLLRPRYYQMWADYYVKFFDAYSAKGVTFWGLTTGNEPFDGLTPLLLPSMGWFPSNMARWLSNNLGPTIRNSSYSSIKIIIHDDQRIFLPFLREIFNNNDALKYADGVAVHWYSDSFTPGFFLNFAKTPKKQLFLVGTEASTGILTPTPVLLGSWERAERYLNNIFEDLEFGASGWIDWNMALNANGGPVYTNFPVDSTIIVNATSGEFYKQPIFYALGHFSKFVTPGSVRIGTKRVHSNPYVRLLAFKRPDNSTMIVILNRSGENKKIRIVDLGRGQINVDIEKRSINNILYW